MKDQCSDTYPNADKLSIYLAVDWSRRLLCNKVADIYHFGVWQLGGESWPMIAFRYNSAGDIGCPWIGAGGQKPDVPACYYDQQHRSYPPKVADRTATMILIAKKIRALIPFG